VIGAAKLRTCGQVPGCCKDTIWGWGWQIKVGGNKYDTYLRYINTPYMKRLLLCNIFNLFILQVSIAQQLHVNWTRFIGGSRGQFAQKAIPTKDGGIVFAGNTSSISSGGGDIPTGITDSSMNVMVGKLDSNKQLMWIKILGGTLQDNAFSVCETHDGGYAVLAVTSSTDGDVVGALGSNDIWLIRLNKYGNVLWKKIYGSIQDDEPVSLTETSDHGFIVLGTSVGNDIDVPFHNGGSFVFDWLVIKTDSNGNKQWVKVLGGNNDELNVGSIIEANGGYYIASSSNSTNKDCNDTVWHSGINTSYDFYLLFIDTTGNVIFKHSYGGLGSESLSNAIWDERDSSILMVGVTTSYNSYMVTNSHGDWDMWVIKTDKLGNLIWKAILGDTNPDEGKSRIKWSNKGYLVCGNSISDNNPPPPHIRQQDVWLFYLDSSGHEQSNKIFGGTLYDWSCSIVPYRNELAVIGSTSSTQFTEGLNILPLHSNLDVFISGIDYWSLSLPNITQRYKIEIFPNPIKDIVHIYNTQIGTQYRIINQLGVHLLQGTFAQEQNTLQIQSLPTGIYLLQLTDTKGQREVVRVVKE